MKSASFGEADWSFVGGAIVAKCLFANLKLKGGLLHDRIPEDRRVQRHIFVTM
jgi:hypothetical protein